MKFKLIIALLLATIAVEVKAQDPVFTQYFLVPETLNPGFTGFLDTWHAGVVHRRQWPNGIRRMDTEFAFVNTALTDHAGVGLTILNHHEEFTNYNYFQINTSYAYKVELDHQWSFRPAIEVGYGRKDFNFGNLLLEDQININDGSISGGSVDPGILNYGNKIDFLDISAGFVIDKESVWFGAAFKHLNRPDISFTENGNVPLDIFVSLHGGYAFDIYSSKLMFLPEETKLLLTANYMRQGQYNRLDLGTAVVFEMFTFGAITVTNPEAKSSNSHFLTSINPFVSLQLDHFIFGYSYDLNTSKLGNTQGIHELSLTWQLDFKYKCWGCPNYQTD